MAKGFVPVRYRSGAPYNGAATKYVVATGDANNIFVGDPVTLSGTGDSDGIPGVGLAAAGARITGFVVGFAPHPTYIGSRALRRGYRAASEEDYLLVADDTNLIFEGNEDGAGGYLAVTDIGNNVDVVAGTGSTYTFKSGYAIDSSTKATTSAGLRLHGLSTVQGNALSSTSTVWQVTINESTETPADGSTGV